MSWPSTAKPRGSTWSSMDCASSKRACTWRTCGSGEGGRPGCFFIFSSFYNSNHTQNQWQLLREQYETSRGRAGTTWLYLPLALPMWHTRSLGTLAAAHKHKLHSWIQLSLYRHCLNFTRLHRAVDWTQTTIKDNPFPSERTEQRA